MLPSDIVITNCEAVHNDFHARFDATLREYHYHLETKRNPFTDRYSWYFAAPLDLDVLK